MSWIRLIGLFVAATLSMPTAASALQLERGRVELCAKADVVVVAEVTSFETVWEEGDGGGLLTRVWFARKLAVRGDSGDHTIELLVPGGIKAGLEHYVEDSPPRPQLDRRYLLFLVVSPRGGFQVLGGEAGVVALNDSIHKDGERYLDAVSSVASCHE